MTLLGLVMHYTSHGNWRTVKVKQVWCLLDHLQQFCPSCRDKTESAVCTKQWCTLQSPHPPLSGWGSWRLWTMLEWASSEQTWCVCVCVCVYVCVHNFTMLRSTSGTNVYIHDLSYKKYDFSNHACRNLSRNFSNLIIVWYISSQIDVIIEHIWTDWLCIDRICIDAYMYIIVICNGHTVTTTFVCQSVLPQNNTHYMHVSSTCWIYLHSC